MAAAPSEHILIHLEIVRSFLSKYTKIALKISSDVQNVGNFKQH